MKIAKLEEIEFKKFTNKRTLIIAFIGVVSFGILINATFSHVFIGEETQLIYKCRENPKFSKKCAAALRWRDNRGAPEKKNSFSLGIQGIEELASE